MNEIQESIARARAAQKGWIEHMKAEGWHGCPVCRAVPIKKEQRLCAACETKLKKTGRFRPEPPPDQPDHPVQPKLDLQPKAPEKKVAPEELKRLVDSATYRKKEE